MSEEGDLFAKIHGVFSLRTDDGRDLTPVGLKERGLLALLIYQPEQWRTRASLQDMLWSESPPEKGAANLRRVLSNVRKALEDHAWRLRANRSHVSFDPPVKIARDEAESSVLFEDIDIPGTEFERWLTDSRLQAPPRAPAKRGPLIQIESKAKTPEVRISPASAPETPEDAFLNDQISSMLAARLRTLGDVTIHVDHAPQNLPLSDTADTVITLRTLSLNNERLVHLRVQALPSLRFLAALHARLPNSAEGLLDHPDLIELVNKAVRAVVDHNTTRSQNEPFFAIQSAVRRVFSSDQRMLASAERLLRDAQGGDTSGLALAWRSFVRLTEVLEFRQNEGDSVQSSLEMAQEATELSPHNPVVWALAAHVHIQMAQDLDLGSYCARRSLDCLNDDPYALDAMSLALSALGDADEAHKRAEEALRSASGLANQFSWDMQCCLTALGVGDTNEAITHARAAHLKVPAYRPAVRYLAALNLYNGNGHEAAKYLKRLEKLEPGLTHEQFLSDEYPLTTLRRLGFAESIDISLLN